MRPSITRPPRYTAGDDEAAARCNYFGLTYVCISVVTSGVRDPGEEGGLEKFRDLSFAVN